MDNVAGVQPMSDEITLLPQPPTDIPSVPKRMPEHGNRLRLRHVLMLKSFVESGGNVAAAARNAGCSRTGMQNLLRRCRTNFPDIMDGFELSVPQLVDKLRQGVDAVETKCEYKPDKEGKEQLVKRTRVEAWGARLQALDMAFKLGGHYPQEGSTNVGISVTVEHIGE